VRLKDKVAIITGGSTGMARAASELFAEKGTKVVIGERMKAQGERIATHIPVAMAPGWMLQFPGMI
ncbi:uncharacterized protein METZ01_LOCUS96209, partial [marine metagenome]